MRLYIDLTGASESEARAVYMHVCCRQSDDASVSGGTDNETRRWDEPARGSLGAGAKPMDDWFGRAVPIPTG